MTIRNNPSKFVCSAAVALLGLCLAAPVAPAQEDGEPAPETVAEATETTPQVQQAAEPKKNPRRADTYFDALQAAGDDGVAVYCYGPDWNQRSLRMLKEFWETPEAEQACGEAIMVAVPFYEDPTEEQQEESSRKGSGLPNPPFGVCPTVMLITKEGEMYANLPGMDYLEGENAYKNLKEKIAALRARISLTKQAETLSGAEKAVVLNKIAELPINTPKGIVDQIKEADPSDSSGMVRRNTYNALQFLYAQMNTKDGFLSPDFEPDIKKIKEECMKVIKDTALRTQDRQMAYALLIGQTRRDRISGKQIKDLINACHKLDPETAYGKLTPTLSGLWGNLNFRMTADERKEANKRERANEKKRREKDREDKKASKNTKID